jgi:hypothetical protein
MTVPRLRSALIRQWVERSRNPCSTAIFLIASFIYRWKPRSPPITPPPAAPPLAKLLCKQISIRTKNCTGGLPPCQRIFCGQASQKIHCPPLCGVRSPPHPPNKSWFLQLGLMNRLSRSTVLTEIPLLPHRCEARFGSHYKSLLEGVRGTQPSSDSGGLGGCLPKGRGQ